MIDRDELRLSVVLPARWRLLDLDAKTRAASIDRMVRRLLGRRDDNVHARRVVAQSYRDMLADAADHGAVVAAEFFDEVGDKPVSASLLVFLAALPLDPEAAVVDDLDGLEALLHEPTDGEELVEVRRAVTGLGEGIRTRVVTGAGVTSTDGREPRLDLVRFYVPLPDLELMAVLSFTTPTRYAADAFGELWDAIARSTKWQDQR